MTKIEKKYDRKMAKLVRARQKALAKATSPSVPLLKRIGQRSYQIGVATPVAALTGLAIGTVTTIIAIPVTFTIVSGTTAINTYNKMTKPEWEFVPDVQSA